MFSLIMAHQFHGNLLSKLLLPPLLIIQRSLCYMKQTKSVFGCRLLSIIYKHVQFDFYNGTPIIIYEGNASCMSQIREGYIKSDRTKHIWLKFSTLMSYSRTRRLMPSRYTTLITLLSLFTIALPTLMLYKFAHNIGMHWLNQLSN